MDSSYPQMGEVLLLFMERNNFEKENEFLFNYSQKETIKKRKWTAFIHRWGEVLLLFTERNNFKKENGKWFSYSRKKTIEKKFCSSASSYPQMGESAFPIHGKKQFWKKKYSFSNNDKRINLKTLNSSLNIYRKKQFQKRKKGKWKVLLQFTERNNFKNENFPFRIYLQKETVSKMKMETIFLLKKWNEFHIN